MTNTSVSISCAPGFEDRAAAATRELGLPPAGQQDCVDGLVLHLDGRGWSLTVGTVSVRADFLRGRMAARLRDVRHGEARLARALGLKQNPHPLVLDATAGLGRDTVLAAALGCTVIACERSAIVALLLRDGLDRAAAGGAREIEEIISRIDLRPSDAHDVLAALEASPDVILVDPMFPDRTKAAKARKEMQILQQLLGPDSDAETLLDVALARAARRVVVKRPPHGPAVGGREPSFRVDGRAARYDVYLAAGNDM